MQLRSYVQPMVFICAARRYREDARIGTDLAQTEQLWKSEIS